MMGGKGSGRTPKPAALKILEGNAGKREIPQEVQPEGQAQMPSRWLRKGEHSEQAREHWNQMVPELIRLGLATSLDQPALEQMCEWYAVLRVAQQDLEYTLAGKAFDRWTSLAAKFGFSPSDRARLAGLGQKQQELSTTERYLA